MKPSRRTILYTDLDGTFLDRDTYSCAQSLPALRAAIDLGVPVVFCSSKTRAEIEHIRASLAHRDPFIVENGGAVYIPCGYFPFTIQGAVPRDGYLVIELGTPYQTLVKILGHIAKAFPSAGLVGFNDMSVEELAERCGFSTADAERAKRREYDEPFELLCRDSHVAACLLRAIHEAGLRSTRGDRYFHLLGGNDKGRAIQILNDLYARAFGCIFTVGLGDSSNDVPMLELVDHPVVVKKADGTHDEAVVRRLPRAHLVDGIGPRGWRAAVMAVLGRADHGDDTPPSGPAG